MTSRLRADICIIGAGSGGLTVAAGATRMGARTVLIEAGAMGGDCLNHGCVPSKALIAAARQAHAMRSAARFGIAPVEPEVDFAAVKDHVARAIAAIAPHDSQERFEALGVTVIRAAARFIGPSAVEAGGQRIEARRFVVATGSRPVVPPIPGLETVPYLTNETLFGLRERPSRLLILGGGPIGLEMAQAHRRLGCEVAVFEAAGALSREDPELAAHGARLSVVRVPYAKNDRAQTEAATEGLVKLMVARNRVVGAGLVGPQAGELVGLWALAIANKLKLTAVTGAVAPYPTLGELNKRAAGEHYAPRLFESRAVKRAVRLVQRILP
jgi:pyruvate/2-oxoglutarate dehydrogenase complex dihydrolipoamide dehydrogenase (E3) component